jgi:hypothetical protein
MGMGGGDIDKGKGEIIAQVDRKNSLVSIEK